MPILPQIVLLADDDEDDVFFITRALKSVAQALTIRHVTNGDDCIRYLKGDPPYDDRERCPFPALLLLDLKMPGKDGFDVLRWLKQHPDVRVTVIVLSGSDFARDREEALRLGAREVYQKPLGLEDIVAVFQDICGRWFGSASADAS